MGFDFRRSSRVEDPSDIGNRYQSISMFLEAGWSRLSFNDLLTDIKNEHQTIPEDPSGMGNSSYLEVYDFQVTKAPKFNVMIPDEPHIFHEGVGHAGKEMSLGEVFLQDLEVVMSQMTERTRIFFRDALYRLAKCSKQPSLKHKQIEDLTEEASCLTSIHEETWRDGGMEAVAGAKPVELGTNAIDRTVANLMFNKLNGDQAESASISREVSADHSLEPSTANFLQDAEFSTCGSEQN